jgi:hypothetical protein
MAYKNQQRNNKTEIRCKPRGKEEKSTPSKEILTFPK